MATYVHPAARREAAPTRTTRRIPPPQPAWCQLLPFSLWIVTGAGWALELTPRHMAELIVRLRYDRGPTFPTPFTIRCDAYAIDEDESNQRRWSEIEDPHEFCAAGRYTHGQRVCGVVHNLVLTGAPQRGVLEFAMRRDPYFYTESVSDATTGRVLSVSDHYDAWWLAQIQTAVRVAAPTRLDAPLLPEFTP